MGSGASRAEIERLYAERFRTFERVARAITGEQESALDAVHDGFADAIRARHSLRNTASLESWVWSCVVHRARKARQRDEDAFEDQLTSSDNGTAPTDELGLRSQLAALPERQRLTIFLRYYAYLDYRGIAEVLGVEVGTVSATLSQAHASLRTALKGATR